MPDRCARAPQPAKTPRAVGQWCFPGLFILSAGTVCVYIQRNLLFQKAVRVDRLGLKGKCSAENEKFSTSQQVQFP